MIGIDVLLDEIAAHNKKISIYTNTFINFTETLTPITIIVSATDHLALASIFQNRPLLSIIFFLHPLQVHSESLDFFPGRDLPSFLVDLCPWSSFMDSIKVFSQ